MAAEDRGMERVLLDENQGYPAVENFNSVGDGYTHEMDRIGEQSYLNAVTKMNSYTYEIAGKSYTVDLGEDQHGFPQDNEKIEPPIDNCTFDGSETKVENCTINGSNTLLQAGATYGDASRIGDTGNTQFPSADDLTHFSLDCENEDPHEHEENQELEKSHKIEKSHEVEKPHEIEKSNKLEKSHTSNKQHEVEKSVERKKTHECDICGMIFPDSSHLKAHLKSHMKESFFCSFCDQRFRSISKLKRHLPVHVVDRMLNLEQKYEHGNKGEVSDSAEEIELSDETDLSSKELEFEHGSKRSFSDVDTPSKRRRTDENNLDESFEQDEEFRKTDEYIQSAVASNNQKFTNLKQFSYNDMAVHGDQLTLSKRVEQGEDGTEMYIKTEMIEDEDNKEGIKQPLSCGLCSETFSDPAELEIHMEMHKETNTYTYKIDGKKITVSLGAGNDKTSGSQNEPSKESQENSTASTDKTTEDQPYKCHLCPKQYNRANSLKRHLILHTGEKPHACTYCDKKFALMSYLTEHLKMHTGGLPFSCKVCHKQFNRLANMKVHMGVHTKEKQAMNSVQIPDIDAVLSLPNPEQQILEAAKIQMQLQKEVNQLKQQKENILSNLSKKYEAQKTGEGPDTEEMTLFKPYMDNYLNEKQKKDTLNQSSDKKQDEEQTTSKSEEDDKIPGQEKENSNIGSSVEDVANIAAMAKMQLNPEHNSCSNITSQIMNIIHSTPSSGKEEGSQKQLENEAAGQGPETVTVKEEQPDEISENSDTDKTPQQTLYNYVVDGKTYTIPLETYTSLVNLDRRLALEDGGASAFTNSFDIKANIDAETGKKTYTCEICFKSYSRSNSLRRHLLVHSGEKSYACDLCDKKFSIKSYLTAHRKIHSGETPFGCTFCLKQFNRVSNLRAHMLVHTGVKPHSCPVCGKLFNLSSNLKRHMTIHTGLKPHVCSVCGKEFGLSSSLKEHMRVHTGENPYKCETCGKQFKQHSNFRRHKSIHTGEKKHVCYICNKSFNQSSSLKRHLTIHPETATSADEYGQDSEENNESKDIGSEEEEESQSSGAEDLNEENVSNERTKEAGPDKKNLDDHVISDDISETISRIVESHASNTSSSDNINPDSRLANDSSVSDSALKSVEEPVEKQSDHSRVSNEKQIDKTPVAINNVSECHISDISSSVETASVSKQQNESSVSSSENIVKETTVKTEPFESPNAKDMLGNTAEAYNPVVDSHASGYSYPYAGNFMPMMGNEAYYGNPGPENYGMPSFRMNIPFHPGGMQSPAPFSVEKSADRNIPSYIPPNYWPANNMVPPFPQMNQENLPRMEMPYDMSDEYKRQQQQQQQQQQWYEGKF